MGTESNGAFAVQRATAASPPAVAPAPRRELKSLQILRAIAATSVVYFHLQVAPIFGSFGVEIFFVISGFVMAMIVEAGQAPRAFVVHRLRRIVPPYWLCTTCVLGLAMIRPDLLNSTTADFGNYVKSLLFIPYFKENGALHPMLAIGWTLNYEMFFYACLAGAMVVARRRYLPLTIALVAGAYAVGIANPQSPVVRTFFGDTILFDFALGLLLHRFWTSRYLPKLSPPLAAMIAAVTFGLMAFIEAGDAKVDRLWVYGLPSLAFVFAMLNLEETFAVRNGRVVPFLTAIGDASYATYLSHFYVVEGIRKIADRRLGLIDLHTPLGVVVTLVAALAFGQLFYVCVDRPLVAYFRRKSSKPARAVAAADRDLGERRDHGPVGRAA